MSIKYEFENHREAMLAGLEIAIRIPDCTLWFEEGYRRSKIPFLKKKYWILNVEL